MEQKNGEIKKMSLNFTHDTIDEIPENYRDLYTERDGKHVLTGIAGVKTQADIDRMQTGLTKEREEHKATKERLSKWGDLDHDEVLAKLDKIPELEVLAKGNKEEFETKLEELTETRIGSRMAPVERENKTLKEKLQETTTELETMKVAAKKRVIQDDVMAAAQTAKVIPEAMPDMKLFAETVFEVTEDGAVLTKENPYGVTPGLSADVWLQEMQESRPHWWPLSSGGDSKGSGGVAGMSQNPFSHDHWNMTKQGQVVTEHGMEKATQMAKAAGTTVGGMRPAPKKTT